MTVKDAEEARAKAITVMAAYDDQMGEMRRKGTPWPEDFSEAVARAKVDVMQADRNLCLAREAETKLARIASRRPAPSHTKSKGRGARR